MIDNDTREYKEMLISTYGGIHDCCCDYCYKCSDEQLDECCFIANNNCNSYFAELVNYGGYDSEEEFWDNL